MPIPRNLRLYEAVGTRRLARRSLLSRTGLVAKIGRFAAADSGSLEKIAYNLGHVASHPKSLVSSAFADKSGSRSKAGAARHERGGVYGTRECRREHAREFD